MTAQVEVAVKELGAYLPRRGLNQNQEPQYHHHLYHQEISNQHHKTTLVKAFYLITITFHLTRLPLHKLKA